MYVIKYPAAAVCRQFFPFSFCFVPIAVYVRISNIFFRAIIARSTTDCCVSYSSLLLYSSLVYRCTVVYFTAVRETYSYYLIRKRGLRKAGYDLQVNKKFGLRCTEASAKRTHS